MKSFGIVYKASCLINGKCYIGQTVQSLNKRRKEHIRCSYREIKKDHFHNALKKHGFDMFKWEIICECYSRKELDNKEKYYIKEFNTLLNGYNLTMGGSGKSGFIPSGKTRKILSDKYRGEGNPFYGKKHTEETKRIISKKGEGRKLSIESLKMRSNNMLGKNRRKHTEEQNINHSKFMKKYPDETIEKCVELKQFGKSYREISELLNVPLGTIKWWYREYIKKILDKQIKNI